MSRSACVPLPTPGAPTRMMRAARLNSLVAIRWKYIPWYAEQRRRRSAIWRRDPGLRDCSWQREKLEASETDILQPHVDIQRGMYLCTKKRVYAQYCDRR